jgi:uncharacterized membrane protein
MKSKRIFKIINRGGAEYAELAAEEAQKVGKLRTSKLVVPAKAGTQRLSSGKLAESFTATTLGFCLRRSDVF